MGHEETRAEILRLVKQFYDSKFAEKQFVPGKDPVRYAGRVFDEKELQSLVDSALDFWLTAGQASFARRPPIGASPSSALPEKVGMLLL